MKLVGPEFYQETDPRVEINYGVIELSEDLELTITIKDINGRPIHGRTLDLQSMQFDDAKLSHSAMCIAY
jgi:hypothetical protein